MSTEDKLMLMKLLLQNTKVENCIMIAKAKQRQRNRNVAKNVSTPVKRIIRKWFARRPELDLYTRLISIL